MVRLAAVTIEQPRPAIVRHLKTENPGIAAGVFVSGGARSLDLTGLGRKPADSCQNHLFFSKKHVGTTPYIPIKFRNGSDSSGFSAI